MKIYNDNVHKLSIYQKNHLYVIIIIKYNNEHKYKMGGAEYENY